MPFRTDLAAESEIFRAPSLPAGVSQESCEAGSLHIHRVTIVDEAGAQSIGKPPGTYVTVTTPPFLGVAEIPEADIEAIAAELAALLPRKGLVLIAGLGNNDITPDAIGPRTVHQILATRHISETLARESGLPSLRGCAALAPGVLGQTGIETSEIIHAVVEQIRPCAVVVVDALAARSSTRLGTTIQISSTGISPGSGVMNARKELSASTLGVPVVSMGVPTVVDASTLAGDLLQSKERELEARQELFHPKGQAMMVTPREIDALISHACKTLSSVINKALQPCLSLEELGYLVV